MRRSDERGFVALISALIISIALVMIVIASGTGGFYARIDALGSVRSAQARSLAASCVEVALLALATSTDPGAFAISGETVEIDQMNGQECVIDSLASVGGTVSIHTHASVADNYRSVSVVASISAPIAIQSWTER